MSQGAGTRWLEISVQADGEAGEAVAEIFNRYGEGGAVVETLWNGATVIPRTPVVRVKTYLPVDASVEQRRRTIEEALWHLSRIYPIPEPEIRELGPEDWAEAWKKGYKTLHLGRRLVIVPVWEAYLPRPDEVVIHMEPGMAFGTGLHPTTRLCLCALEDYLRPGDHVLDVGTGSGILAIAAAKLGAAHVLALDIDPTAVDVARSNVARNDVAHCVEVHVGTVENLWTRIGAMQLIVINILADTVMALAPRLAEKLAPRGHLISSGILQEQAAAVETALQDAGLAVVEQRVEGDWVALVSERWLDDLSHPAI